MAEHRNSLLSDLWFCEPRQSPAYGHQIWSAHYSHQLLGVIPVAQQVLQRLVDDIDGSEGTQTVEFSLDGKDLAIDPLLRSL